MHYIATLFLAVQISNAAIGGFVLPARDVSIPASSSPTTSSIPTQSIHIEQAETPTTTSPSSSTSSAKNPPLFLPVTAAPPDTLGIANVSGFYGPGAWASWFLTIVGAWVQVLRRSEEKVDVNTALFLLGTNWAAVDIFRSIHAMRNIQPDQPDYKTEFIKCMGSYGAAITVVFWGTVHALLLTTVTKANFSGRECMNRRLLTLTVGLVLPFIALVASTFGPVLTGLNGNALEYLPALYWMGMGSGTHSITYTPVNVIPFLPLAYWFALADDKTQLLPKRLVKIIKIVNNSDATRIIWGFFGLSSLVSFVVSFIARLATGNGNWEWGMALGILFFVPILIFMVPLVGMIFLPISVVIYIFKGYLHLGSNVSESCFFMPCTPQSISDEDQIYALLAGLFALVGFELLPPILRKLRKEYRDRRLFEEDVKRRLRQAELRRSTSAPLNH
ncbi:hypothetical protein B7463_g10728, partial [Scytalidium lignicola]